MKKLLCLFGVTLLTLTSCSNDDNNSSSSVLSILPKTVSVVYSRDSPENNASTYVYNGNKIVSKKDRLSRTDYTYDGNVIVKMITYYHYPENGIDSRSYEESYTYANGKLATCSSIQKDINSYPPSEYKGRYVYTYNTDGTIKKESYSIDPKTGVETKINTNVKVCTFENGNLVKEVTTWGTTGSIDYRQSTTKYEYDNKNNPMKNILGFNILSENGGSGTVVNNVVKVTYSSFYGAESQTYGPHSYMSEYMYNDNGYPTKIIESNESTGPTSTIEYTYY